MRCHHQTYYSAQNNNLLECYWSQIEHNTNNLLIPDWDRCKKMRLMAALRAKIVDVDSTYSVFYSRL